MAEIIPFRGILYNQKKIGKLETVVAPPYDVISTVFQENLYQKSEYNIVRLILGKTFDDDNEQNNRYTRAAKDLNNWLKNGVLHQNGGKSLYFYSQEYLLNGEKKKRIGFIARVKIEEYDKGVIHPHEFTLSKPIEDRLKLTRACRTNFSQVFGLFSDSEKKIDTLIEKGIEGQSLENIMDPEGIVHVFGKITDREIIESITSCMRDKKVYIADGHHRYETALTYRNELRKKHPDKSGKESFDYVMMYLTNMDSEGMSIFPIHRLLFNLDNFQSDQLLKSLEPFFNIQKIPFSSLTEKDEMRLYLLQQMKLKGKDQFTLGLYLGEQFFYLLMLKNKSFLNDIIDDSKAKEFFELETYILHSLIIEKIMGIKKASIKNQDHICFKKSDKEAVEMVDSGKYQLAFFLNSTRVEQVKEVVNAGARMPQKSTFFYPKLLSGLVINPLTS